MSMLVTLGIQSSRISTVKSLCSLHRSSVMKLFSSETDVTPQVSTETKVKKPLIFALKKTAELGLQTENADADASFEILSVMHKSNARFSLRQLKGEEELEEDDPNREKHYAPQHRRFLTHPKVGPGTPANREKVSNSVRLDRAASVAHKYQMTQLGFVDQDAGENMLTKHKGLDSTIEDKIQLSILQGDFDNLQGSGQPRKEYQNPLVDRTTDLAFDLLKKNGVRPEWIELQQCMNLLKDDLRARLRSDWALYCINCHQQRQLDHSLSDADITTKDLQVNSNVLPFQMPGEYEPFSSKALHSYEPDERVCNVKVDAYNLQVPSHVLTRGRVMLTYEVQRCCEEVFSSVSDAENALTQCSSAIESLQHVRYSVQIEIDEKQNGKSSVSPGQMYSRTMFNHSANPNKRTGLGYARYQSKPDLLDIILSDVLIKPIMRPFDRLVNYLEKKNYF